jgi:DNA helicase HerA-like ATPase
VSNTPSQKEVGLIVGEASSNEFYFASQNEEYPPKWEYVMVFSKELVDGKLVEVPVVAQVEKIISVSEALGKGVDVEALRKIIAAQIADVRTWGQARVLGYLTPSDGKILQPRRALTPGNSVFVAPDDVLSRFYSLPPEEGLLVGELITRSDVPVYLSLNGFRRHVAIIAQTGAGKSYAAGVLIEELIKKGATIIVLDPHADYVRLSLTPDGRKHEFSERVTVFRNPSSTSRNPKKLGKIADYEISFSDLSYEEVCDVAGVPDNARNIREAVRQAVDLLEEKIYTPEDLLEKLENPTWAVKDDGRPDREWQGHAHAGAKYIRSLTHLKVFGTTTTRIESLLGPSHVSIVDLSGLEDRAMNYIASKILQGAYDAAEGGTYEFPIFVIVEEAHKFVPPMRTTYASLMVNKIAAEGRKFGVFLCLITQRPSKVDPDSLSQCNSQLIMKLTNPEDQNAVEQSSERLSADLLNDLPGLNPGESVIVGEVTRAPVMVKIRARATMEGGADVDVVKKLEEARRAAREDSESAASKEKREPFRGEFS